MKGKQFFVLSTLLIFGFISTELYAQFGVDVFHGEAMVERKSIMIPYTVSDSRAHSLVKIWISEMLHNGINGIGVDDPSNGIITGEDRVYLGGGTVTLRYRFFIEDGNVEFYIERLRVQRTNVRASSQAEADRIATNTLEIWENNFVDKLKELLM